jgi:hypothetical protein
MKAIVLVSLLAASTKAFTNTLSPTTRSVVRSDVDAVTATNRGGISNLGVLFASVVKRSSSSTTTTTSGQGNNSAASSSAAVGGKKFGTITNEQVRALFGLWNDALATGDSRIVASRYAHGATLLPTVRFYFIPIGF